MKSGFCPKCESNEVRIYKHSSDFGELKNLTTSDYCCMECGYIETYLAKVSLDFISALKNRFAMQAEKTIVNINDEEFGMKSGICSKCSSNEVRVFSNRSTMLGNTKRVYVDDYCCTDCGFSESYIRKLSLDNILLDEGTDDKKKKKRDSL